MPSLSWYFYKGQQVLFIPGKLLLLAFQGPANFFQLFKDRLLDEAWQHGYEVEANIEALAEVIWVDRHPLELQEGQDGYAPEPEGPADPQAKGEGDLVSAVGSPVNEDIGGHADLPSPGQQARQEVLDVRLTGHRSGATPGHGPPVLGEDAAHPFFADKTQRH